MCVKVKVLFQCFAGLLSATWSKEQRSQCAMLTKAIQQNALNAWQKREPNQQTVRFMQKMSGNRYRFFIVSQQGDKLVVTK